MARGIWTTNYAEGTRKTRKGFAPFAGFWGLRGLKLDLLDERMGVTAQPMLTVGCPPSVETDG